MNTVMRLLAYILFSVLYRVLKQDRYRWMAHYLGRSGTQMDASKHFNGAFTQRRLEESFYCYGGLLSVMAYETRGFYGKPELFYLVGGFRFSLEQIDSETARLTAQDVYDWHPGYRDNSGEKQYYASPIPMIPSSWVGPLNRVLGHEFFKVGFAGDFAVSNYLWEWLDGKPFTTTIDTVVDFHWLSTASDNDEADNDDDVDYLGEGALARLGRGTLEF